MKKINYSNCETIREVVDLTRKTSREEDSKLEDYRKELEHQLEDFKDTFVGTHKEYEAAVKEYSEELEEKLEDYQSSMTYGDSDDIWKNVERWIKEKFKEDYCIFTDQQVDMIYNFVSAREDTYEERFDTMEDMADNLLYDFKESVEKECC